MKNFLSLPSNQTLPVDYAIKSGLAIAPAPADINDEPDDALDDDAETTIEYYRRKFV